MWCPRRKVDFAKFLFGATRTTDFGLAAAQPSCDLAELQCLLIPCLGGLCTTLNNKKKMIFRAPPRERPRAARNSNFFAGLARVWGCVGLRVLGVPLWGE